MPDVLHGDLVAIGLFFLGAIIGIALAISPRNFFKFLFMPRAVLEAIGPKISLVYRIIGVVMVISCGYSVVAALLGRL